jgi:hypothetical protein
MMKSSWFLGVCNCANSARIGAPQENKSPDSSFITEREVAVSPHVVRPWVFPRPRGWRTWAVPQYHSVCLLQRNESRRANGSQHLIFGDSRPAQRPRQKSTPIKEQYRLSRHQLADPTDAHARPGNEVLKTHQHRESERTFGKCHVLVEQDGRQLEPSDTVTPRSTALIFDNVRRPDTRRMNTRLAYARTPTRPVRSNTNQS